MTIRKWLQDTWMRGESVCELNNETGAIAKLSDEFHAVAVIACRNVYDDADLLLCRTCAHRWLPAVKQREIGLWVNR